MANILRKIKQLLPKNEFARGVSILTFGTAGSQILTALFYPLITRLYTPSSFGILAIFSGLLSIILVFSSLRYEQAIILPEKDVDSTNILIACILILLAIVLFLSLIIIFFNKEIINLLKIPTLSNYLFLLPIGVLLAGLYQIFNYWAIRFKNFSLISKTRVSQSITSLAVQVAGYRFGPLSLIMGQILGQATGGGKLGANAFKQIELKKVKLEKIRTALIRYRKFPLLSVWSGLFNTASLQLIPLALASLFSPSSAGLYALTSKVFHTPMSMISGSVANVFFARASETLRTGNINILVSKVYDKMSQIGILPVIFLAISGPRLFPILFGSKWIEAGVYIRLMAPWFFISFVTSPLTNLFAVMEKQVHALFFQLILITLSVISLSVGYLYGSVVFTISLLTLGNTIYYIVVLSWIVQKLGVSKIKIIKNTLSALFFGLLTCSPLLIIQSFSTNNLAWFISLFLSLGLIGVRYFYLYKKIY